jgi:hypothetical protein
LDDTSKPKLLSYKNYLAFIDELPGSRIWRHLYAVNPDGKEVDLSNGVNSCAYMVSSVLHIFGWIDQPHATVKSTIREMENTGWRKVTTPEPGDIILWDGHVGFYLADNNVISTNSDSGQVERHGLTMSDGRRPLAYYHH